MSKYIDFLAEKLKNSRKQLGLSQDDLAEKTGLSVALISEIERGIANPTLSTLEKIADFFQMPAAELLNADDVLNNQERLKGIIRDNIDKLDLKQLKTMLLLIRLAQK